MALLAGVVVGCYSFHFEHFFGVALFDGDVPTGWGVCIEAGGGHGHIKGYFIILCGQGFEVGSNLIGHIAIGGYPVSPDDHQIHQSVLHEVSARVVGDEGTGHTMFMELVGGEFGALISRTCLIDPHMDWNTSFMGQVYGGGGGTVVYGGEPSGVAVGEDVDGTIEFGVFLFDDFKSVGADGMAAVDFVLADWVGFGE